MVAAAAVAAAGYAAWIGPAAAAVSFGAALSTVALPFAAVGGGLVMAKRMMTQQSEADRLRLEVSAVLTEARARVWEGYVEQDVLPRLRAVHHQVTTDAERALDLAGLELLEAVLTALGAAPSGHEGVRLLEG